MESLHDSHRRSIGPVEFACRCLSERDVECAQSNGPQARIGVDHDPGRYCVCQAKVVSRRHSINQYSDLVAARDCVDHTLWVWWVFLMGQFIDRRPVIEATINPT